MPTNLLTGTYGNAGTDYAGTWIGTDTVRTFPNIDLIITQPTPYDYWMRIGIYTETPDPSLHSPGDLSIWPASVCGTYTTSTEFRTPFGPMYWQYTVCTLLLHTDRNLHPTATFGPWQLHTIHFRRQ